MIKIAATLIVLALMPIGIGNINSNFKIVKVGLGMMIIGALIAIWS